MDIIFEGNIMKNIIVLFISTLFLSACSHLSRDNSQLISPMQAVELSAANAPKVVEGEFMLTIKSGYVKQRMAFLNSELDHHDQRNLIIALRPRAIKEMTELHGEEPANYFIGKKIKVSGEAKRVKKWVFDKRNKVNEYYYQTHIFVNSANQVSIL